MGFIRLSSSYYLGKDRSKNGKISAPALDMLENNDPECGETLLLTETKTERTYPFLLTTETTG